MTDSDEFIEVGEIPNTDRHVEVFQIQPEKKGYKTVKIGEMRSSANALIHRFEFGGSEARIVNCLYTKEELYELKKQNCVPMVEIYTFDKEEQTYTTVSYCVRPIEEDFIIRISGAKNEIVTTMSDPIKKDRVVETLVTVLVDIAL